MRALQKYLLFKHLINQQPDPLVFDGSGCFLLDYGFYHLQADSRRQVSGIRGLSEFGRMIPSKKEKLKIFN
jgi:hypothetical protein